MGADLPTISGGFGEIARRASRFIASHQLPSGAIPWYQGGVTDPWDHVECAMALDIAGMTDEAARAYQWLRDTQNRDGSWYYNYLDDGPQDLTRDSNHSAYIASGVWQHYLVTGDMDFLRTMWPVVEGGIEFALGLQQPTGDIYWALDVDGNAWQGGLLGAASCTWKSIMNATRIAERLGHDRPGWHEAAGRLAGAIRHHPELFDRLGENKRGYAMNWYYPVLAGLLSGGEGRGRILQNWEDFIVPGWGCLCSLDQVWVTPAETSELVLALGGIGERERGRTLLVWIMQFVDGDGGFWTGMRVPEGIIYPPDEKTTWTAAGVVLAIAATDGDRDRLSIGY
ncbi:hypothetical protein ACFLX5_00145 [Chloroflexota bacterium]